MNADVDQRKATAGRDLVGRDVITTTHIFNNAKPSLIEQLVLQAEFEIQQNKSSQNIIGILQAFYIKKSIDGIDGLEAKLKHAGRSKELISALERKEAFSKFLEQYSLYESAQKIFAVLLSRAEQEFESTILPHIPSKSETEINTMILDRIVTPTMDECGTGTLMMTHRTAMGMFYWLAEQCFVRWHD